MDDKQKLLANIVVLPNGCWEWQKSCSRNGYGSFCGPGAKVRKVHRVAYEIFIGPIPKGLELDHTCHKRDNCDGGDSCRHRRCCNPEHLEPVTRKENVFRGYGNRRVVENRKLKTHCSKGHEYDEKNTYWYRGYRMCRKCHLATQLRNQHRYLHK